MKWLIELFIGGKDTREKELLMEKITIDLMQNYSQED